jgi:hypothetical protein
LKRGRDIAPQWKIQPPNNQARSTCRRRHWSLFAKPDALTLFLRRIGLLLRLHNNFINFEHFEMVNWITTGNPGTKADPLDQRQVRRARIHQFDR